MKKYYSYRSVQKRNRNLVKSYNSSCSKSEKESILEEIIFSTIPLINEIVHIYSERYEWSEEEELEYQSECLTMVCEIILKDPSRIKRGITSYIVERIEFYFFHELVCKPRIDFTDSMESYYEDPEVSVTEGEIEVAKTYISKVIKYQLQIDIFYLHILSDYSLEQISIRYQVTRERIRQIVSRVLSQLVLNRKSKTKEYKTLQSILLN